MIASLAVSTSGLPLLAAGDEDSTMKVIIGVAVAIFWIIAQIAGALGKKKDESLPPSQPAPSKQPPPIQQRERTGPPPQQRPPKRQKPPSRPKPAYVPPPMPERVPASPPMMRAAATRVAESGVAPTSRAMPRREMLDALLRPRNLRKAYILNELLQPPVSLRQGGDGSIAS